MKLNCKQGDLAIIVKSTAGNEGKIVRCLEYMGVISHITDTAGDTWRYGRGPRPVWRIDRTINFRSTYGFDADVQVGYCSDECLRPLRGDTDDESATEEKELNTVV